MIWVQIRSRRDPAFWAPLLVAGLVIVPLGIWAHHWVSGWIGVINKTASVNPEAAKAEAVRVVRISVWVMSGFLAVLGVCLFRYFQLGLREGRLPPSGWWSLGAFRAAVGRMARCMSWFGLVFSLVLPVAAIGFAFAVEHLLQVLLYPKPGV